MYYFNKLISKYSTISADKQKNNFNKMLQNTEYA